MLADAVGNRDYKRLNHNSLLGHSKLLKMLSETLSVTVMHMHYSRDDSESLHYISVVDKRRTSL